MPEATTTPTPTETAAPAQEAPKPRKSATRQVEHKAPAGSSRELKESIGNKIGDRLAEVANDGANNGTDKIKVKSHFRTKTPTAPPPDPETPEKTEAHHAPQTEAPAATENKEAGAQEQPVAQTGEGVSLPDAHRRSLENFGWTPEEIENGLKQGAPFLATAAKLHKQRSNEIDAYARAGQAGLKAPEQKPVQQPSLPVQGTAEQRVISQLAEMKKSYPGNDKLFDMVMAPQIDTARAQDAQATQQRESMLQQQVSNFFSSKTVENYKEFYGDATEGQSRKDKVVNLAAYIIHGAAAQHKQLTVEEALQMAHDSTAAPVAKAAARAEITQEIKDRAAGLTQKNQVGGPAKTENRENRPLTRKEIEDRAGQRMKAANLRPS